MSFNKAEQLWNEEGFSMEKDSGGDWTCDSINETNDSLSARLRVHGVNINSDWGRV